MTLSPDLALEESIASALKAKDGSDDSQLDASTRRQLTMAAISRKAAEAENEKVLLSDAGRLAAESLDMTACAVAVQGSSEDQLNFWYCNLNSVGREGKDTTVPAVAQSSLAGFSIQAERPVVCSSLEEESRFSDAILGRLGVQSALACPLQAGEGAFGCIMALSTEPHKFQAEDVLLLDAIAGVAAVSIAKKRMETELNRQKLVRNTILETLDAIVLELTPEGRILNFNRACQILTGFAAKEVQDRHLWSAFLAPEEVAIVQSAFNKLKRKKVSVSFESYLLTKQGDRRRVSWSFSPLTISDGKIETLIGTGVDISNQLELQEKLHRSESANNEAKKSLDVLMAKIESGDLVFRAQESQPFSELKDNKYQERRAKPRRAYPYIQMVGPVYNNQLPTKDEFQPMRCKDIAAGGFSFLCARKPTYEKCVVAFGVAPSLTYLMARVVHSREVSLDTGDTMFVVGCQYTGRVEY